MISGPDHPRSCKVDKDKELHLKEMPDAVMLFGALQKCVGEISFFLGKSRQDPVLYCTFFVPTFSEYRQQSILTIHVTLISSFSGSSQNYSCITCHGFMDQMSFWWICTKGLELGVFWHPCDSLTPSNLPFFLFGLVRRRKSHEITLPFRSGFWVCYNSFRCSLISSWSTDSKRTCGMQISWVVFHALAEFDLELFAIFLW